MSSYLRFFLQQSESASEDSAAASQKLQGDLQAVFNVLPKDMQQLMLSNPKRAALLQGSTEPVKIPVSVQGGLVAEMKMSFLSLGS